MRSMLRLYRRHTDTCPHKPKGRLHHRCQCPIWVDNGGRGKNTIRYSLNTTVWTRANEKLRDLELGVEAKQFKLTTVQQACELYLDDCEARRLAAPTVRKMRCILTGSSIERMTRLRKASALTVWSEEKGIRFMQDFSQAGLEAFRASWKDAPLSAMKRLDQLRSFFGWAKDHGMCKENYAAKLRRPVPRPTPTLPFSREEFQLLLDGCYLPIRNEQQESEANRVRLRSLLLVIRYSGLRISDALELTEDRIAGGKIRLYQAKTGEPVYIPLPEWLVKQLHETPKEGPLRWFMRPNQSVKNAHEHWRRKLEKVAKLVKVANPGFHRIRDTFAVEMLLAGVPIHQVSILLGHTSIKITEKHYAPWVRERQDHMDSIITAAQAKDPLFQKEALREVICDIQN